MASTLPYFGPGGTSTMKSVDGECAEHADHRPNCSVFANNEDYKHRLQVQDLPSGRVLVDDWYSEAFTTRIDAK